MNYNKPLFDLKLKCIATFSKKTGNIVVSLAKKTELMTSIEAILFWNVSH